MVHYLWNEDGLPSPNNKLYFYEVKTMLTTVVVVEYTLEK